MEGWSSMRCALTWSIWGTRFGRASFLLRVSAHPTDETGYGGLLITPTTTERCEDPKKMRAKAERNGYKNGTQYNGLTSQVVYGMLGTPTARHKARSKRFAEGRTMNPQEFANAMLPTPIAGDWKGQRRADGTASMLSGKASLGMLPTPAARDYKGANSLEHLRGENGNKVKHDSQLPNYIKLGTGSTSQLNPRFVAEMMGFPANWTELPFQSGAQNP